MKALPLAVLTLCLSATSVLHAADGARCQRVTLADAGLSNITMTTAVARLLLSELGYRPSVKRLTLPATYQAMAEGKVDVFLGNRMPAQKSLVKSYEDSGKIAVLQTNLPMSRYSLAVVDPKEQHDIRDFADIHRFKHQLDGKIFGLEPGSEGNEAIKKMIQQNTYGLGDFTLVESSETSMLNAVEHAERQGRPAVFLAWEPHPMNKTLKLHYLTGAESVFGESQVNTVVRTGLIQECPNLARLLKNLVFTVDAENQLVGEFLAGNTNRRRVAKQWMQQNPQVVSRWLAGVTTPTGEPASALFRSASHF